MCTGTLVTNQTTSSWCANTSSVYHEGANISQFTHTCPTSSITSSGTSCRLDSKPARSGHATNFMCPVVIVPPVICAVLTMMTSMSRPPKANHSNWPQSCRSKPKARPHVLLTASLPKLMQQCSMKIDSGSPATKQSSTNNN